MFIRFLNYRITNILFLVDMLIIGLFKAFLLIYVLCWKFSIYLNLVVRLSRIVVPYLLFLIYLIKIHFFLVQICLWPSLVGFVLARLNFGASLNFVLKVFFFCSSFFATTICNSEARIYSILLTTSRWKNMQMLSTRRLYNLRRLHRGCQYFRGSHKRHYTLLDLLRLWFICYFCSILRFCLDYLLLCLGNHKRRLGLTRVQRKQPSR
jgi:hypothetical protein